SENVDLVRSVYADWERGEFSRAIEWAHPEIEWVRFGGDGAGAWTGLEALTEATAELLGGWQQVRAEAEEYRDLGDERVLVLTRWSGRDSAGSDVELLRANLFRVREGKVVRLIFYWDRERALADLGLTGADSPGEG
ncbi:MAG TPA: nuclear transport factor 2 family protein, partial [Solirubrobacteraceae bacterium]